MATHPPPPVEAGLCALCAHVRRVRSDRGAGFYQCRRSACDPDYPAYPRLPVLRCRGFERADPPPPGPEAKDAGGPRLTGQKDSN